MNQRLYHPLPPGYSGPAPEEPEEKKPVNPEPKELSLDDTLPIDMSDSIPTPVSSSGSKIRTFEQKLRSIRHEDNWNRTPNANGTGAIHVKSFHCKLTGDSLEFLDQQINEWLDAHPQYEVKFVTATNGIWSGKTKEPSLILNVWV